jgi:hypothetical protein
MFRPNSAIVIGSLRIIEEGINTRMIFVPKSLPLTAGSEKFFEGSIISENEKPKIEPVEQSTIDFMHYIKSEKRMSFWRFGKNFKRQWIQKPEKHAKDLLQTFLSARFGMSFTFEEIIAGAGKIDLLIISPSGESLIIELKMCGHGNSRGYASQGIEQLKHYFENKKAKYGYLIIFDSRVRGFSQGFSNLLDATTLPFKTFVVDVRPFVKMKDSYTSDI